MGEEGEAHYRYSPISTLTIQQGHMEVGHGTTTAGPPVSLNQRNYLIKLSFQPIFANHSTNELSCLGHLVTYGA